MRTRTRSSWVAAAFLFVGAIASPAAAQIDATGQWSVAIYVSTLDTWVTQDMPLVQNGTALAGGGFAGTIDPVTGAFHLEKTSPCGSNPSELEGVVASDGASFTGTYVQFAVLPPALCVPITGPANGTRTRQFVCGDGIHDPTEACDGDACCDASCEPIPGCVTTTTTTTTTSTTTTTIAPDLLSATKIELSDGTTAARKRLVVTSKDRTLRLGPFAGSDGDPTIHGGSLRVRTASGDTVYPLPAANWSQQGPSGYRYRDPRLLAGPVASVKVKQTRSLGVTAKGALLAHSLATDPRPVEIVLTLGSRKACLAGGGTETLKPGLRYTAKAAPAPATCPP